MRAAASRSPRALPRWTPDWSQPQAHGPRGPLPARALSLPTRCVAWPPWGACRWAELKAFMAALGYAAVVQARAAAAGSDFMLAVFYRADRLRLAWSEERSRALLVALEVSAEGPTRGQVGGKGGCFCGLVWPVAPALHAAAMPGSSGSRPHAASREELQRQGRIPWQGKESAKSSRPERTSMQPPNQHAAGVGGQPPPGGEPLPPQRPRQSAAQRPAAAGGAHGRQGGCAPAAAGPAMLVPVCGTACRAAFPFARRVARAGTGGAVPKRLALSKQPRAMDLNTCLSYPVTAAVVCRATLQPLSAPT